MENNSQLYFDRDVCKKITEFWQKYGYYSASFDELYKIIQQHLIYNTVEYIEHDNLILGFARYTIEGSTCICYDAVIRKGYENKDILKLLLIKGWKKYPLTTKLKFEREGTKMKEYEIAKFLGVK